jgi:MFS family permease
MAPLGLPKTLYLLTATTITLFLASQTIQPILSLYITAKGATTFELGVIISLLSFVAIGAKIPLGLLAEHVGKWPIIPAVAVGQTVSLLLYSIVPDPTWFFPIRIFHALVLAAYAPTALAITQDLAPEGRRGLTMGVFLTAVGATATLGPLICTFLVAYLPFEQVFQAAAVIPLLGLFPYSLIVRATRSRTAPEEKANSNLRESLRTIVSSWNMLLLTYLRLAFSFTNAFFITFFAIHATDNLLLSTSVVALLFGIK